MYILYREERIKLGIDWKSKLSSRKFWALVVSFVSSNLYLFGVAESEVTQIVGALTAFGAVVTYIIVEGSIDKKNVWGE